MKRVYIYLTSVIMTIFVSSCLESNPEKQFGMFNASEEFLTVIETRRPFITPSGFPYQTSASQVYKDSLIEYIIDLRTPAEFASGHISRAINIPAEQVYSYIKTLDTTTIKKIILVCSTGEVSLFAAGLMRLAGYSGVYAMRWGMSCWHEKFIYPYVNYRVNFEKLGKFTGEDFLKKDIGRLPDLNLEGANYEERIANRVNMLLAQKSSAFITTIREVFKNESALGTFPDYFLICFGPVDLYRSGSEKPGHPRTTVLFTKDDFLSSTYLLTIPTDKKIVIYDMDGQTAPAFAAYLNFLGYDAYSIKIGANSMLYEQLLLYRFFSTLRVKDIMNYTYVTGM